MSEFIGESAIIVRADTRAFLFQVKKAIKTAEALPCTVTVTASMAGFRAELLKGVQKSSAGVTAKVLVRPDMTGFRTALAAAVKKSSAGITVPVSVVPVTAAGAPAAAAPAAAAAATGGGAAKVTKDVQAATKAEKAFAEAEAASAFARKRVTGEMTAQERSMAILVREEAALTAGEKALKTATTEGNVALEARARALVATQRASVEARRGVISRRQAQIDAPQIAQQAARQKVLDDAAAIDKQKQTLVAKGESAQTRIVQTEAQKRAQIEQAFNERDDELRASRAAAIDKGLKDERAKTIATSQSILGSRAQQDEKALQQRLKLESQLGKLQRQTRALPAATGLTSGAEITAASQQAGRTQTAAIRAADTARQAGLVTLTKEFEKIEAENLAIKEQLSLQRRLNVLREQSRVAALPQLGRTPSAGLSKEANALSRAEQSAARLAEDARQAGVRSIEQEATALTGTNASLKDERIESLRSTDALNKNTRARTDVKRAAQSQLLTFAGLRGAALSAESAFLFAAAGTIAFVKAVQSAAALQTELNTFQATAGATADQMKRVSETALQLGRDVTLPGVNAQDAAEALTELSKAGLSVEGSIDGARGVLQLATAASIDNAEATELAASALNAFGLAGAEATHVADVLANAANDSQGSIVDIGIALRQSAAVGRQAGLTFEQVSAALTIFARNGLVGSDAGTSFRTALIRLINPTTKAQEQIDKLGLHLRTATGAINLGVFDEFTRATKDLTAAQRDQALAIIFGQDAIRGAAILARTGSVAFDQQVNSLNKSGTAAELAAARTKGLAGSMENLKNQLTDVGLGLGAALSPAIQGVADTMATAIQAVQGLIGEIGKLRKAAGEPIDIVVNIIQKADKGVGTESFADKVLGDLGKFGKTLLLGSLPAQVGDATARLQHMREVINQANADFEANKAFKELPSILQQISQAGKSPTTLNNIVKQLLEMQQAMKGGSADTEVFRQNFDRLIDAIQSGSSGVGPIEIPAQLRFDLFHGREVGKQSGIITAKSFSQGFIPGFTETLDGAGKSLEEAFGPAAEKAGREIKAAMDKALRPAGRATNQALGFSRAETQARIRGDVGGQIAAIEGTAAAQRKIIDAINKATQGDPKDKLLVQRTKAESTLADAIDQIASLKEGQASDIKDKAQKVKDAQDKADQAVIDALAPATRRLDTRALIAQGTPALQDDIAIAKAQQADNRRRIAVIDKSFKDRKAAATQIADLQDQNIQLQQDIDRNVASVFQTKVSTATDEGSFQKAINLVTGRVKQLNALIRAHKVEGAAFGALVRERNTLRPTLDDLREQQQQQNIALAQSIFDSTGASAPLLRALDAEIANTKAKIKKAEEAGRATKALRIALIGFINDRESAENQKLQTKTDLAQSIFDLTGNKKPLLKALNAQIKETQRDIAAAKKAGTATDKLKTELNGFLLARKNLLKDADEEKGKGTTAFDLLTEFNTKFKDIAGNFITPGGQPFAGASEFLDSIVGKATSREFSGQFIDKALADAKAKLKGLGAVADETAAKVRNAFDPQSGLPKGLRNVPSIASGGSATPIKGLSLDVTGIKRQETSTNSLISALDRNTAALLGGGGRKGSKINDKPGVDDNGVPHGAGAAFRAARQAREVKDG